jgi:ABC-type glutathione transport system ATPase component
MQQMQADSPLAGVISRDPGMLKVCRNVEKVAPTSATVMLLGESGTGKEVLARALHRQHCRRAPEALHGDQLRGDSGKPARERTVRLREGRLHRRRQADQGQDRDWRTAAPSSSTKSATCRCRCRPSCCASCRSA